MLHRRRRVEGCGALARIEDAHVVRQYCIQRRDERLVVVGPLRAHRHELMFCVYAPVRAACHDRAVRVACAFLQRRSDDVVNARLVRLRLPPIVQGAEVLQLYH